MRIRNRYDAELDERTKQTLAALREANTTKLYREEVSLTQLLINDGAFDVAKSYIDFLKDRATLKADKAKMDKTLSKPHRSPQKKKSAKAIPVPAKPPVDDSPVAPHGNV